MTNWEGVTAARGEHRTTGGRAWCHDDREWCYPNDYCPCCYHADDAMRPCACCGGTGYVTKAWGEG